MTRRERELRAVDRSSSARAERSDCRRANAGELPGGGRRSGCQQFGNVEPELGSVSAMDHVALSGGCLHEFLATDFRRLKTA